jgi:hypothetical protein
MAVLFKQLMAAATDWRTLIILGAGIVAAAVLSNPFPALIALGIYLWAVQRLASSPRFREAAERVKTLAALEARYKEMEKAAQEVIGLLPRTGSGHDRSWYSRANDVLRAARSIYSEWLSHRKEHEEQTERVDEAMQLATLYMRNLRAYQALFSGHKPVSLDDVKNRMARNKVRLEQTMDLEARTTLMEAIEMDQRVLDQEGAQETERERYEAKLAAVESTMDLLQRQIYDPGYTPEGSGLQDMLREASAMDEAMQEVQHRTRVRAR